MVIELSCTCGRRLQVAEELSGRTGQCPVCGTMVQIPGLDETAASAAPSLDREDPGIPRDAVTPAAGSAARAHSREPEEPGAADREELTRAGCVLTLLSVVVLFAVALSMVRWRDPATRQPLPRSIAIVGPVLIGAAVNGLGTVLLKCLGLPVWRKREKDAEE